MKPPKIVQIVFPTDGNMNMMPIVYDKIMIKAGHNMFDDAANYVRADIVDEMLEALETVAPHLNVWNEGYIPAADGYWTGDVPADVENAVLAAIAKAKGEGE